MNSSRTYLSTAALLVLFSLLFCGMAWGQKLKPADLIEKHLASIGGPDLLKQRISTAASAVTQVDFLVGGSGHLVGNGLIGSNESKAMILMTVWTRFVKSWCVARRPGS